MVHGIKGLLSVLRQGMAIEKLSEKVELVFENIYITLMKAL